jgi:cell division septation protein DedD
VPEFNFAKGSTRKPKESRAEDASTSALPHSADVPRAEQPAAADNDLPYELHEPPRRDAAARPAAPPAHTAGKAAPAPMQGSVLDKYPARDFSHLDATPTTAPSTAQEQGSAMEAGEADDDNAAIESATPREKVAAPTRWPIYVIASIVLLLVLVAMIWHLDPWPPLKHSIATFFSHPSASEQAQDIPTTETAETVRDDDVGLRSWDYYLQVSSWKDLGKADQEAERFRAKGLDVAVESEPIPTRGGTFYRVRLGPYANAEEAYTAAAAHPGLVPPDAFIDSVRLTEPVVDAALPPAQPRGATRGATGGTQRDDMLNTWRKDFAIVDEPLSGYAVQVSSLKNIDVARIEARKMVENGYPAFITRANVGATTWYRVLVGPFRTKADADKYMRLINVTFGNEAYTIDLAAR